jgi:hypothetical protein
MITTMRIRHQISPCCPAEAIDTWMIWAASMLSRPSASIQLELRHTRCRNAWAVVSASEASVCGLGRATLHRLATARFWSGNIVDPH